MRFLFAASVVACVHAGTYRVGSVNIETLREKVARKWEDYKFGDAVEGFRRPSLGKTKFIDYCCNKYPGSVICDYRRYTDTYNNYTVLANISRRRRMLYHTYERGCHSLPKSDELVVHLRLGDIHVNSRDTDAVAQEKSLDLEFYRNDIFFGKNIVVVANIQRTREKHGTALHMSFIQQSIEYLTNFTTLMTLQNSSVTFRTNCLPDEDFVYMTHAYRLQTSGGGFSVILGKVQSILMG